MPLAEDDLYATLGVSASADQVELRDAYRRLARLYHPDRAGGDERSLELFRCAAHAYATLSDPPRRALYDASRRASDGDHELGRDLAGPAEPRRGRDVEARVELSFADSLRGVELELGVAIEAVCAGCGGAGCAACRWQGLVETQRTIPISVPPGIRSGTRLRLAGRGDAAPGEVPPGDLYVHVDVEPSALWSRRGDDLLCELHVTFPIAALGGQARLELPDDRRLAIRVPRGAQPGSVLRVRGQGITRANGSRGDLLARLTVSVPRRLTPVEEDAIASLARVLRDNPQATDA